jgi:hypothetical protein
MPGKARGWWARVEARFANKDRSDGPFEITIRQAIVDTVFQGGRRVGYTLTAPELPGHDDRVAPVRVRDVEASR